MLTKTAYNWSETQLHLWNKKAFKIAVIIINTVIISVDEQK